MKLSDEVWITWCRWIERIRVDVEVVVNDGATFREFRSLAEAHGSWIDQNGGWRWTEFTKRTYAAATFVGIRRQLKNDRDSISLRKLLEQVQKCSGQLSYDFYLRAHPLDNEEEFVWQRHTFGGLSEDGKFVSARRLESDLDTLRSLNVEIEKVADRAVAHLDRRGTDAVVSFDDLARSVRELDVLTCEYVKFFTGAEYGTLKVVDSSNWSRLLRRALTPPG